MGISTKERKSSQQVSPVNHSVLPGSEEARKTTVTSGQNLLESYERQGPLGSLVRMLVGSSTWHSTRCYLIWKLKITKSKRSLFQLVPKTPSIAGTESGSLQSGYMIPTPSTTEAPNKNANTNGPKTLTEVSKTRWSPGQLWPTPCATEVRQGYQDRTRGKKGSQESLTTKVINSEGGPQVVTGKLNPMWVEWLMGYPIGWTDLKD